MNVEGPRINVYSGSDLVFSFHRPAGDSGPETGAAGLVQTLKLAKAQVNQCLTQLVEKSSGKGEGGEGAHSEDGSNNEEESDDDDEDEKNASSKPLKTEAHFKRKISDVGNGSRLGSSIGEAEGKRVKS